MVILEMASLLHAGKRVFMLVEFYVGWFVPLPWPDAEPEGFNRRADKTLRIDGRFVFISNIDGTDEGDQKSGGGDRDRTHSEFL